MNVEFHHFGPGQLHTPAALRAGKISRCPLDRRLGGLHSRSGCYGDESNLLHNISYEGDYEVHTKILRYQRKGIITRQC
jgi:hypothetical protein